MEASNIKFVTANRFMITKMSWERLFLNLTISTGDIRDAAFSLARVNITKGTVGKEYPLEPEEVANGAYYFRINMSLASGTSFADNGRWYFIARGGSPDDISLCCITAELARRLDDLSKVFPYGNDKYSYNVSFASDCIDSEFLVPILVSKFMIENRRWKETNVLSQSRSFKSGIECLKRNIRAWFLQRTYNFIHARSKGKKPGILIISETHDYLWGNLKFLDERLKERGLDERFDISYSFSSAATGTNTKSLFRLVRLLARQKYVFLDDFSPILRFVDLASDTEVVQLWHAGVGFKSVGYCRFGLSGSPHPEGSHRKYTHAVVGSDSLVDVYSEVFGQPKERILPLGMARLDGFLDEKTVSAKKELFYSAHPELQGKKLILFCPTFRGAKQKDAFYDYDQLDLKRIYDYCGDSCIWAFKMHPFIKDAPKIPAEFGDRIIDLTQTKDINDLYYVTDIMITDYSSAFYEYSLFGKPVLFFTYDREMYEVTRGVHRSISETAPGRVCDSFDELMEALSTEDYEIEKTIRFREENFGEYDGKAADRIIDRILLS